MEPPALPPPLPPNRLVKIRGWVLVLLGLALCAGMRFLIYFLKTAIAGRSATHWNGDAQMTAQAFGLFGWIFYFGLAALVCGISLLRRGRIGPVFMIFFLLTLGGVIWYGYQILSYAHPA